MDAKKDAAVRRLMVKRLNRTVARLSASDIEHLDVIAQRLVERSAKPVLPNLIEEFSEVCAKHLPSAITITPYDDDTMEESEKYPKPDPIDGYEIVWSYGEYRECAGHWTYIPGGWQHVPVK